MPRPRNTKIKVLLEVREFQYQRIAVRAFHEQKSVHDWCQDALDKALEPALVSPSAEVVPVEPIGTPADAVPTAELFPVEKKKKK